MSGTPRGLLLGGLLALREENATWAPIVRAAGLVMQ